MRNINTKILNLAIFQKLIFGIFTGIFVKNGGEKETKLDTRSLIGLSDWSYDFKRGYTTWVGDKRRKIMLDPMCILY